MDSETTSSNSISSQNFISNECNSSAEKTCNSYAKRISSIGIFSKFVDLGIEGLQVSLLSILFIMSGLILFLYGLLGGHLYQYVMAFFFLVSGFILDDVRERYLSRK